MEPGLYPDFPERDYHDDPCETPSLTASVAKSIVLESPAHAYLRHPRLGGERFRPTDAMDRGTLIHALLLGKGPRIAIIECDDWTKKNDRELRDMYRDVGKLPVSRKVYDAGMLAASELAMKLNVKGYSLTGQSEVTMVWRDQARNGAEVLCRGRVDHVKGAEILDLKITDRAHPKRCRAQAMDLGYDIQDAAYTRGLGVVRPELLGRVSFTLLFCEPEPPYAVTPVRCAGSARMVGEHKWTRGLNRWERCLREGNWPDYCDGVTVIEAKPWEIEEEMSHDIE